MNSQRELKAIPSSAYEKCMEDWFSRYHNCIAHNGDYFEGDKVNLDESFKMSMNFLSNPGTFYTELYRIFFFTSPICQLLITSFSISIGSNSNHSTRSRNK